MAGCSGLVNYALESHRGDKSPLGASTLVKVAATTLAMRRVREGVQGRDPPEQICWRPLGIAGSGGLVTKRTTTTE